MTGPVKVEAQELYVTVYFRIDLGSANRVSYLTPGAHNCTPDSGQQGNYLPSHIGMLSLLQKSQP